MPWALSFLLYREALPPYHRSCKEAGEAPFPTTRTGWPTQKT